MTAADLLNRLASAPLPRLAGRVALTVVALYALAGGDTETVRAWTEALATWFAGLLESGAQRVAT